MKRIALLAASALLATVLACTANTAPEAADHNASAVQAAEPAPDLSGTWAFDLEASDVAAPTRAHCAEKASGDGAKQAACWAAISTQAKTEKIRFTKTGARTLFTSFGEKDGVYLEMPVELVADGQGHVLAKVAGTPTGPHAANFQRSNINAARIEIVDARTIALEDPKKGRLVYQKEQ